MELLSDFGGTLLQQYVKGGPAMHPISVLSIVSVALIFYKVHVFRKANTNLDALVTGVRQHVLAGNVKKALETCESHRGPVAVTLKVGLLHSDSPSEEIERHIEAAAISSIAHLRRYLGGLATISNIAPLIGFFGTVVGMIMSFEVMSREGMGRPELVAKGISVALLTTAFGLLVAFLTQPFYNYFVGRIAEHSNQIDVAAHAFIDALKRRQRLALEPQS